LIRSQEHGNLKPDLQEDQCVTEIKPGRYKHFKGGEYEVIGIAQHSETLEKLVVYRPLYGEKGIWVRPLDMFLDMKVIDGTHVPRFEFQGEMND